MATENKISQELEEQLEDKTAYICAQVYTNIPWSKLNIKSAHKYFIDRIRASSNTRDFKEFLDTFTKKCGVDFVRVDTETVQELQEHTSFVMDLIRRESVFLASLALEHVDTLREQKKLRETGQTTL